MANNVRPPDGFLCGEYSGWLPRPLESANPYVRDVDGSWVLRNSHPQQSVSPQSTTVNLWCKYEALRLQEIRNKLSP
uniref:Uncharacterized protein n=1 Tax=viral metagenome TaxID=1070528 RepID=A0A6C0HNH7_9ZZZZ